MQGATDQSAGGADHLVGRVRLTYWVALLLVAAMAVVSFFLVDRALRMQSTANDLVHLAGEQQMLSQRIVLLTNTSVIEQDRYRRAASLQHLRDALSAFERNQGTIDRLLDDPRTSAALRLVLTAAPHDVSFFANKMIVDARRFLDGAGKAAPMPPPIPQLASTAALAGFARLAEQMALDARQGIEGTLRMHRAVFSWMILMLAFEALVIFQPMLTAVSRRTMDLVAARNHMAHMARHDSLTGLKNRTALIEEVEALTSRSSGAKPFGLLHIDIDRFKAINDVHGHAVGDEVLRSIAQNLTDCVRETDIVARHGGDEFVVVLTGISTDQHLAVVADHVLKTGGTRFSTSGEEHSVGISIGASLFPRDGSSIDELIAASDRAMYAAKRAGRGRVRIAKTVSATLASA